MLAVLNSTCFFAVTLSGINTSLIANMVDIYLYLKYFDNYNNNNSNSKYHISVFSLQIVSFTQMCLRR